MISLSGHDPPAPRIVTATPRCSAIVVSYNSAAHLPQCLSALEAQRGVDADIYVVDNASSDGSGELVRHRFPRVHLVENVKNVGFARGNNQVLEQNTAEFYALVNPDTVASPAALAACVEYLTRDSKSGVVAVRLVYPDGTLQPSCHAFLGLRNLLGETLGAHRLAPGLRQLSSLYMPWFAHDRIAEVDWIDGAFLVVRGEVVRTVGGFDPDFFMYGEEMEWCHRIRRAGWNIVFLPDPAAVHVRGASSGPIAGPMFIENLKGRVRYLRKHRGPMVATAARVIIAVSVLLRYAWRETQGFGLALTGRRVEERLRLRQTSLRSATRWVLRGLPLTRPDLANFEARP